jgi:hypothetical protein
VISWKKRGRGVRGGAAAAAPPVDVHSPFAPLLPAFTTNVSKCAN